MQREEDVAPAESDSSGAGVDVSRLSLARRIRELRLERGVSGRAIAKEIGVTSGFISQIEQGAATPSVTTLIKLANALDVAVGDFFEGDRKPGKVLAKRDRVYMSDTDLGLSESYLSRDPHMTVVHMRLAAGGTTGRDPLVHESDSEFIIVTKGAVTVTLAGEETILKVGDSVQFVGQVPHAVRNPGPREAELIWVVTPSTY